MNTLQDVWDGVKSVLALILLVALVVGLIRVLWLVAETTWNLIG